MELTIVLYFYFRMHSVLVDLVSLVLVNLCWAKMSAVYLNYYPTRVALNMGAVCLFHYAT